MKLSDEERGYLAGILDGEGSVMIYRNATDGVARLVIQLVTSTNFLIFDRVRQLVAKAGYRYRVTHWKGRASKGWNPAWMLHLGRMKDQKRFILEVGPLVVGKAEHIKVAAMFLEPRHSGKQLRRNSFDDLLISRIKELNRRGTLGTVTTSTPDPLPEVKIQSELFGDEQSAAEMTAPPKIQ